MRVPVWLDRAWTAAVGLSFLFLFPLWILIGINRFGIVTLSLMIGLALWLRFSRVE